MSDETKKTGTALEATEPNKPVSLKVQEFRGMELAARYAFASQYKGKNKSINDAVAIVLYGRELGVPPMEAIKNIHCVEGKFEPDYTLVLALIYRNFPGTVFHWLTPLDERRKRCKIECVSPQRGTVEVETRIEDFQHLAASRDTWRKYPERMLMSKAVKLVADMLFTDVLTGDPNVGALHSETRETLDEADRKAFPQRPKVRDNLLTPEQNKRKEVLKEQCRVINEAPESGVDYREAADEMEAEWKSQGATLQ